MKWLFSNRQEGKRTVFSERRKFWPKLSILEFTEYLLFSILLFNHFISNIHSFIVCRKKWKSYIRQNEKQLTQTKSNMLMIITNHSNGTYLSLIPFNLLWHFGISNRPGLILAFQLENISTIVISKIIDVNVDKL